MRWYKWILLLLVFGILLISILFGLVCWRATMPRTTVPSDCIIVLGARVWPDGRLSDMLRYRCESALKAYQSGLAKNIIVSGAQGADEPIAEAEAMLGWFLENGVPVENIFIESRSKNTQENLNFSHAIMQEQGWDNAIVVTNDYHLERALWIAQDEGIDASGIPAQSSTPFVSWGSNRLREVGSWGFYWLKKLF